ncbi:hypothetical protein B0H14DRAFT_2605179 [Mycena olivaceomarginata]|nr:hypothetical protein B0H14DRAFT_2605179 [Mycena olivaceomarginata]
MRAEGSKQSVPNAARMAHRKVEDSNQGTFSNNRLAECRSRAKPQRAQVGTSAIRFVPNRSNVEESRLESRDRSPIQLLTKGQRQGTREHPDTNTKRKKKRSQRNKKNRNNESLEPEARVRCGWTARPGEREAGKEVVVFFLAGGEGQLNPLGHAGGKADWAGRNE